MDDFYTDLSFEISKLVTKKYSTSFSRAVSFLGKRKRNAIYSIYGFVRYADEIVDTFHDHNQGYLINKFESDFYEALNTGISMNPVLHSFQKVVVRYGIDDELIQAFLRSMKTDLHKKDFTTAEEMNDYVYGSAEVVGLMCLKVFVNGDQVAYDSLEYSARKLGSAFQKVNFLRDLKSDMEILDRRYFPEIAGKKFDETIKRKIIADIEREFDESYAGIKKLPKESRIGVLIAFNYYRNLLNRIRMTPVNTLLEKRIRVPDFKKWAILLTTYFRHKLDLVQD